MLVLVPIRGVISTVPAAAVVSVVVTVVVSTVVSRASVQGPCFGVLYGPDGKYCQRRGHGDRQFLHLVLVHRVLLVQDSPHPPRIGRMRPRHERRRALHDDFRKADSGYI